MLVKGKILLAALLTGAAAANAAPLTEIPEDVVDGGEQQQVASSPRGLQYRYGVQPHYADAEPYQEAKKYVAPQPTPKPSSYTYAPATTMEIGNYRNFRVWEDDVGQYVMRKQNGVAKKVYTNTAGWNAAGASSRVRTGWRGSGTTTRARTGNGRKWNGGSRRRKWNGGDGAAAEGRTKKDDWSPPTPNPTKKDASSPPTPNPTPWKPDGWVAGTPSRNTPPTYAGGYNSDYRKTYKPDSSKPTGMPTWDNDGHGRDYGTCVGPMRSACCDQKDHYSFDQKLSLCKKLGCDYLRCNKDYWNDDAWKSGNEPTAMPTWDTDGHDPTAMPTWGTDAWKDDNAVEDETSKDHDDECTGAARAACCSQTKGDEQTMSTMCTRLKCDWNKCQKEPGWGGDTHSPTDAPSGAPSTESPSISHVPTWSSDGWNGDSHDSADVWSGDGQCSEDEQDRCCSQHESKSLEVKAKTCTNNFGCSVWDCPQYRQGADGWFGDSFDELDWDDDGHLDDTCTADEQSKCCDQHDGISITKQHQICKNMWNCNLLRCPKHRQSGYDWKEDGYEDKVNGYYEDVCSLEDKVSCCNQYPSKLFDEQYSFCNKLGCNLHKCDQYIDGAWNNDGHEGDADNVVTEEVKHLFQIGYGGDDKTCSDDSKWKCCSPLKSLTGTKARVKNCKNLGCDWGECPANRNDNLHDSQFYDESKYEYGDGNDDGQCNNAGKWNCCNPDSSLRGLNAWMKNCEDHACEWQKCPHHRQGYYDSLEPTTNNKDTNNHDDKYDDDDENNNDDSGQCTKKSQSKCCAFSGSLKDAAKNCMKFKCDIADCNKHDDDTYNDDYLTRKKYGDDGWKGDHYEDYSDRYNGNWRRDDNDDEDEDDKNGGVNKGPKPDSESDSENMSKGNTGSRNGSGNFMDPDVDENCIQEYTSGGACRLVCKTKVEYKILGVVMSTNDETTTRSC